MMGLAAACNRAQNPRFRVQGLALIFPNRWTWPIQSTGHRTVRPLTRSLNSSHLEVNTATGRKAYSLYPQVLRELQVIPYNLTPWASHPQPSHPQPRVRCSQPGGCSRVGM